MKRPEGLGALEYVARLALGPLALALPLVGWLHGWDQVGGPAVLLAAGLDVNAGEVSEGMTELLSELLEKVE